jgi:hypothetical protein
MMAIFARELSLMSGAIARHDHANHAGAFTISTRAFRSM